MEKYQVRILIDRMGVRGNKCFPLYDKLIEEYGESNIYVTTEKKEVIEHYANKVTKIVDIMSMIGMINDKTMWSCANQYTPVDCEILRYMSEYQHIIMLAMSRQVWNESYLYMVNYYFDYLAYWIGFLEENSINVVLFEAPPHEFHDMLIYFICKYKNIKTLMFAPVYSGFYILTDDIYKYSLHPIWDGEIAFNGMVKLNDAFTEMIDRYTNTSKIPTAESTPNFYKKVGILKEIDTHKLGLSRRIAYAILYGFQTIFHGKNTKLIRFLFRQQHRDYLNTFGEAKKFYDSVAIHPDYQKKYVYVALHYQPEMTTLTFGGYYENQILMIRLLSKTLPDEYVLYVKEHPRMFVDYVRYPNARDIRYYQELNSIENVRLIESKASTYDLIDNSAFIATVTGTVGIEALFRDKQVLYFGRAPFDGAPGSYRVGTISECKSAVKEILGNVSVGYRLDNAKMEEWLLRLQNRCVYGGMDNIPDEEVKLYRKIKGEKEKYMFEFLIDELEKVKNVAVKDATKNS